TAEHDLLATNQPIRLTEDCLLWTWGETYGYESDDGYISRQEEGTASKDAVFYRNLYAEFGRNFVSRLNGEFSGALYEEKDQTLTLFTDRLGSRPLFITMADDG
ncbi:MAG: asparagine synthase, partial [Halobacteriaceae archaeon]